MSNDPYIYNVLCFTTNTKSFEPLTILKKYITSSGYNPKKIASENPLNIYYNFNTSKILISFLQIINLEKERLEVGYLVESYIILVDLENDNTYENLDMIINCMNNYCDLEKTVFILGLYSNAKNIQKNMNEENVKEFLDGKNLIYEYIESNYALINDFNKAIDFILEEGIKKVEKKIKESELKNKTDSESESHCNIF